MKKVLIFCFFMTVLGCVNHETPKPFDCAVTKITIAVSSITHVSNCSSSDGRIEVSASGGQIPYLYRINGGTFSESAIFQNLGTGSYIIEAKDANGCLGILDPSPVVENPSSTLHAIAETTSDNQCLTNNGTISITATGGKAPYSYRLGSGTFGDQPTFTGLENSTYVIEVRDAEGCSFTISSVVNRGISGITWSGEIQSIISTNCAVSRCHNGSIAPNLNTLKGVQEQKEQIRDLTGRKVMPPSDKPSLSTEQIKKIACWIDDGALSN